MKMSRVFLLALFVLIPLQGFSQAATELRDELLRMSEQDQRGRRDIAEITQKFGADSPEWKAAWDAQGVLDTANMQRLEEIVAKTGWPKKSEVGEEAAEGAFLILQHANLAMQQKYLPVFRDAVVSREADVGSYALLYDRILMEQGKKQLYGTQLRRNETTNEYYVWPIENEADVDARRQRLGMSPLQEYLDDVPVKLGAAPESVAESFEE